VNLEVRNSHLSIVFCPITQKCENGERCVVKITLSYQIKQNKCKGGGR